ncbi:hypothetical protein BC831DRAFT_442309 [Entophlyctis helioformis]|nr:hypothetical protein BC831DRAFT_442309 [Entophlyctis helioformis]
MERNAGRMADDILIDPAPEVLPEDLDSFRSEWIQEVRSKLPQQQRQETAQPPSQRPLAKALGQTAAQKAAVYRGRSTSPSKHASGSTSSELRHGTVEADNSNSHDRVEALSKEMAALELYRRGEDEERQGRLSESVRLYRKAIRMDHNVEQNIRQIERQRIKLAAATSTLVVRDAAPHAAPAGDEMDIVAKITAENPAFSIVPSEAQDGDAQQQAVGRHFVSLPAEVIVNILKWAVFMDLGLVVDLSLVCKRMFLLVREQSIWKFLCWQSLLDGQCFSLDDVRDRYALNWRNVWMEKPRVWLDGVYISRVNYLRTGFSETFNQPVLVVTYFRYLRLLPGNKFMIHTSTLEPKAIVRVSGLGWVWDDVHFCIF